MLAIQTNEGTVWYPKVAVWKALHPWDHLLESVLEVPPGGAGMRGCGSAASSSTALFCSMCARASLLPG